MEFDLDKFESILIKGIISDPNVLANLHSFLSTPKDIFKNKDYISLVCFYKLFFDKREKIPTKDEIELYVKDKTVRESIINAIRNVNDIDFQSMDQELFFKTAERFIKERSIWNAMISVAGALDKGAISPSEILEKFEKICSISLNNERGLDLYDDLEKVLSFLNERKQTLSTGFKSLDDYIDGGMYADGRALYMFMAPPNKGKSLFLGNFACNIANQGKTVLVISLEMSELAYAARFCSQQSSVPFSDLCSRVDDIRNNLKNAPGKIIIKEFPPSTVSVLQLKAWIKKHLVEKGIKFDAIIIDYLNLFDGPGSNLYEKIKRITEEVRALSYVFSVPVVSATQQNRSASGKEMTGMNSVSESMGIPATTDVLWEIFQNEEDKAANFYRVGFSKNRYGPVGMAVTTKIDYETLRIIDMNESTPFKTEMDVSFEKTLDNFLDL